MSALDAIRAEIAELQDAIAGINARREQINPEIARHEADVEILRHEHLICLHDSEQAAMQVRALERALAVLTEQAPVPETIPEPREPIAVATRPSAPSPTAQRVRDDLRDSSRARRECIEADRLPAGEEPTPEPSAQRRPHPNAGRQHATADTIVGRANRGGYESPREHQQRIWLIQPDEVVIAPRLTASPIYAERAEIVLDLLVDVGGTATSARLSADVADFLECKATTAQRIVSDALAMLYSAQRIQPTGQVESRSPVWTIVESEKEES
jgi:hypothetical protein